MSYVSSSMASAENKTRTVAVMCSIAGIAVIIVGVVILLLGVRLANNDTLLISSSKEDNELYLALIKSPTCPHCVAVTPIFEQLKSKNSTVQIIDGTLLHYDWFVDNRVTGFPTICAMRNNKVLYIHRGARTRSDILNFWNECNAKITKV